MIDLNMGPRPKYPVLRLVIQDDQDAAALATAVSQLVDRGLRVGQTDIRRRIGIDEPKDGEELLIPAIKPADAGPPADGPAPDGGKNDPVKQLKDKLATHSQQQLARQPAQDSIDALIAEQMGDWQAMTLPLMQPILELAARCKSYDEFLAGLPGLIPAQNSKAMAEALAKSLFAARLAGVTRADVGPT